MSGKGPAKMAAITSAGNAQVDFQFHESKGALVDAVVIF